LPSHYFDLKSHIAQGKKAFDQIVCDFCFGPNLVQQLVSVIALDDGCAGVSGGL